MSQLNHGLRARQFSMGDSLLALCKVLIQFSKRTRSTHRFRGVVPQLALSRAVAQSRLVHTHVSIGCEV